MLISIHRPLALLFSALLCAAGLLASAAWAQSMGSGQGLRHGEALPSVQINKLEILQDTDARWVLADVMAGRAGAFMPTQARALGSQQWGSVVWARITLGATPATAQQTMAVLTVLELPKNYLDHVRLYTQMPVAVGQAPSQWVLQEAGDTVPPAHWAIRGIFPRFGLPSAEQIKASGNEQQVLYMQVVHNAAYYTPMNVFSAAQAVQLTQQRVLAMGLILGAILMTVVVMGSLAWLYRDAIYSWYCVYALFAGLTSASHAGFAHQTLWPVGGDWPGLAVLVFLMLAVAGQLQFALLAFSQKNSRPWRRHLAHTGAAACLINALAFVMFPTHWNIMYLIALALLVLSVALIATLAIKAVMNRNKLARAWLLAYVPLVSAVVFSLLEGMGSISGNEEYYQLPIYAAGIAVIILGVALQWFARERHGEKERERALASTDPLTGFASASSFKKHLEALWHSSEQPNQDTAIVYIALRNGDMDSQRLERLLLRSVRVLRAATSSQDVVARLEGRLLALLMPGLGMGEQLSQRLSRVIALGLMPDGGDAQGDFLKFRIAYTTRKHYKRRMSQLDEDLRNLLEEQTRWGSRPIRVLDHRQTDQSRPREILESTALEDIWNQALTHTNEQPMQQNLPLTTDPSQR
jgi:GGDEF domain-containing protein